MCLRNLKGGEEIVHSVATEEHNEFRLNYFQFFKKPFSAGRLFFGERVAIIRRAVFNDVGDIDIFSFKIYYEEHFCQEFPRRSDERFSLRVFRLSRRFTDENNL